MCGCGLLAMTNVWLRPPRDYVPIRLCEPAVAGVANSEITTCSCATPLRPPPEPSLRRCVSACGNLNTIRTVIAGGYTHSRAKRRISHENCVILERQRRISHGLCPPKRKHSHVTTGTITGKILRRATALLEDDTSNGTCSLRMTRVMKSPLSDKERGQVDLRVETGISRSSRRCGGLPKRPVYQVLLHQGR